MLNTRISSDAGRRGPGFRKFFLMAMLAFVFLLSQPFTTVLPARDKEADEPPPSEDVVLDTKDGLKLHATFYPGTEGNQSVPVILLHMWKGSRGDFAGLAKYLQRQGHAVLVPDLRGHGDSVNVQGLNRPLEAAKLSKDQFLRMVDCDLESLKKFLMRKNNRGELNINKLCLLGAEMGAVVALDWAYMDWSWPVLNTGKQGQDVKALVLLSPQWSFRGLNVKRAMANRTMLSELSVMIVVGKGDPRAVKRAKRFEAIFRRNQANATADKIENRTLFHESLDTSLQGTKLLGEPSLEIEKWIADFIKLRLAKQNFTWKDRTPGHK